ncbi:hypothetical protein ACFYMO_00740 [Streptomyces sp. NPDC007025]|uniref:DUF7574 domain-containing protein n=1 Tax=Streptomyces sp. NPDC007025 TaxID=3364771 RepID=UPI0036C8D743
MASIYYDPEKFGAEIIDTIDTLGGYEFCMLAVFKRLEDGALFFGTDAGCSCHSPFEDSTWESMEEIRNASWFAGQARKWLRDATDADADDRDAVERLIRKVRKLRP